MINLHDIGDVLNNIRYPIFYFKTTQVVGYFKFNNQFMKDNHIVDGKHIRIEKLGSEYRVLFNVGNTRYVKYGIHNPNMGNYCD